MSNECWKESEFRQCCCTCKYRVNDWSHPHTNGESIMRRRGFICANPEIGHYSGWGEHGLCEVWTERPVPTNDGEREWFHNRYGVRQELLLKGEPG